MLGWHNFMIYISYSTLIFICSYDRLQSFFIEARIALLIGNVPSRIDKWTFAVTLSCYLE